MNTIVTTHAGQGRGVTTNPHLPDIWGAGQMLGFSGFDGPVDWYRQLVLHTDTTPGSFLVRLPFEIAVQFTRSDNARFEMILSDAVIADTSAGRFELTFADSCTAVGVMPASSEMIVAGQVVRDAVHLVRTHNNVALYAATRGGRWALFTLSADAMDQADAIASSALSANLTQIIEQRVAFVRDFAVPSELSANRERLLRKAISVIKVNTMSQTGRIKRMWSTPDRWPHQFMWLWDSAFHAVGMLHVDAGAAKETLLAMLEQVREDGFLPLMIAPDDQKKSVVTQPPILAWAVSRILEVTGDVQWARTCEPYLKQYLDWDRLNRDENGNNLFEWFIEGNPLCRSGESGMDNSPRFDLPGALDAVDFSSFLAGDYACLARIAEATGNDKLRDESLAYAQKISDAVNTHLWNGQEQFYHDRNFAGAFCAVKASSGFLPMLAGIASTEQADALVNHLANPATFGSAFPVPSISLDSGTFCKDMWRGPTWININYLIYRGLLRYGYAEQAASLREKILDVVDKWYQAEGCIFEYYDALDTTSPRDLDRKQRLASGRGIAPISDYQWSAGLTAALLLEPVDGAVAG